MTGKFITFEGIDGAGKSSHIDAAKAFLSDRGISVRTTREPGGTVLGERIRALFLENSMSPHTEALLVFAARREHLERVVWPALEAGSWVLCDRFTDASFAYQGGGRELGAGVIAKLAEWVHPKFRPDLTLLFDLPPDAAKARVDGRGVVDRIEQESAAFHTRVREAYLSRAENEPARIHVFDTRASLTTVREQVLASIAALVDHTARGRS
ncbi:MAG: dTMP kinase [Burkholderiales bacterium]|nr:MAG: dTMP kinase [Burkholderiales bacterium]TAG79386.1 MAG: dTMP kinase [Betaproteobacteria bacterium]